MRIFLPSLPSSNCVVVAPGESFYLSHRGAETGLSKVPVESHRVGSRW